MGVCYSGTPHEVAQGGPSPCEQADNEFMPAVKNYGFPTSLLGLCRKNLKVSINYNVITRDNWEEISEIEHSVIYNCTPVSMTDKIHKSNRYINSNTNSQTGKRLATLQASKQFELYTNLTFPF